MPTNSSLGLTTHIAKLKKAEAAKPKVADDAILFWGTADDRNFLPQLKGCVGAVSVHLRLDAVTTLTQVKMCAKQKGITRIIATSIPLLKLLLKWEPRAAPALSSYAGSYFTIDGFDPEDPEIELVFIQALRQLVTVPYGKFMATRLITKLTKPEKWFAAPDFTWQLLDATNEAEVFQEFSRESVFLISVDIETFRENATIRCISYTAFFYDVNEPSGFHSETVVLPLDSEYNLAIMRKFNWQLKAPKVLQNGKYDVSYLARYSAPLYNWLYDTANLFHSWYSELPKDLGFLNAFLIREAVYWKDLANTNDLHEYYRYNALDTWGTGCAFIAMLLEAPEYAFKNYLLEFPLVFPCHMAEMRGIERDMDKLLPARAEQDAIVAEKSASLDRILGVTNFNVKSYPQMKALLKILGCGDLKSADEKNLLKARFRHPFNARVINLVLEIRAARTLNEKYLQVGAKAKEFHRPDGTGSRILYALNPHGTDTGRLAAKEHHFWCGLQPQNIPRGPAVKQTFKADEGFLLCEVDLAQAESRDTAYISGDETLIHNVEYSPDFHCANASAFFGVPFEELFDVVTGKVLQKELRQIGKPVNHGANYNMGWAVLVQTMGEEMVLKAKRLLKLPKVWTMRKVAEHLLEQFHKTYPGIRGVFYAGVIEEVEKTRMITSTAVHHSWHCLLEPETKYMFDGASEVSNYEEKYAAAIGHWTRYCFGSPSTNKQHLNAYIAHPPQNLNAITLNKAWLSVFFDIAIHPKYKDNFKLIAQIHDSIIFQHRIGHEYLKDMVVERMQIPVTIKAYDGKIRTFTVPADASKSGTYWSDLK